jgi:hypothetical protein
MVGVLFDRMCGSVRYGSWARSGKLRRITRATSVSELDCVQADIIPTQPPASAIG